MTLLHLAYTQQVVALTSSQNVVCCNVTCISFSTDIIDNYMSVCLTGHVLLNIKCLYFYRNIANNLNDGNFHDFKISHLWLQSLRHAKIISNS